MNKKLLLPILIILVSCGRSETQSLRASLGTDGSVGDVQAKCNNAANGDVITMPVGTFTWPSGVVIKKGITLQGAGSGSTKVVRGSGYTGALVSIQELPSDLTVRITGIRFESPVGQSGDKVAIYMQGPWAGSWGLTKIRVDNCYFEGGQRVIYVKWRVAGVIHDCTFHNPAPIFLQNGDDDYAWQRAGSSPKFGTSDSIFFEDNTIIGEAPLTYFDVQSDINVGGKVVWRYNNFDFSTFPEDSFGSLIENHGNQSYFAVKAPGDSNWLRAGIITEIYNNTFKVKHAYRLFWFRGGRAIVANNTITGGMSGMVVAFDEEEGVGTIISPKRTGPWPAEDQINNTFIWGNTLNGQPVDASWVGVWQSGSTNYVQKDRDYWMKAPDASINKTYPQPGSPSIAAYPLPYNPPVTSWTPYTYPHPLRGGGTPAPTPSPVGSLTPSPSATATATVAATSTPSPSTTTIILLPGQKLKVIAPTPAP